MNEEVWVDIKGYEGIYQISNLGRVRSLDRWINHIRGEKIIKGKLLKPNNCKGYLSVDLCKDGKRNHIKIHRLVAEAFIPNPEDKPCVDHINTNPSDNRVENLRWVTYRENNLNPLTNIHMSGKNSFWFAKKGKEHSKAKPIIQMNDWGKIINIWDSAADAHRELDIPFTSISFCCSGRYKSAGGYKWAFMKDYLADWLYNFQLECEEKEKVA